MRHLLAGYDLSRDKLYGHVRTSRGRTQFLAVCRYLRPLHPPTVRIAIVPDNFSSDLTTTVEFDVATHGLSQSLREGCSDEAVSSDDVARVGQNVLPPVLSADEGWLLVQPRRDLSLGEPGVEVAAVVVGGEELLLAVQERSILLSGQVLPVSALASKVDRE